MTAGEQIRTARREAGMTQAMLAEALGRDSNTVARWERGEIAVDRLALLAVERVTEVREIRCYEHPDQRAHAAWADEVDAWGWDHDAGTVIDIDGADWIMVAPSSYIQTGDVRGNYVVVTVRRLTTRS